MINGINGRVSSGQGIQQRLAYIKRTLEQKKEVAIGLPADSGYADNGLSMVRLGAIHEFGGVINHPGGTRYVIGKNGRARFVSNDYNGPVSGVTKPHKITIPERSFLRVPLRANQEEIASVFRELLRSVIAGELTLMQALNQVGAKGASISQEAISAGIAPANAASTVRQKGSSKPLVNTGAMRQAITWVVRDKE